MYITPKAERLSFESEEILNLDLFFASVENDETDNQTSIEDLLGGLLWGEKFENKFSNPPFVASVP